MKLLAPFLSTLMLLAACSSAVKGQPALGLMKPNLVGEQVIYMLTTPPAGGESFFVLSPNSKNRRAWCCATISGVPLQAGVDTDFLSAPDEEETDRAVQSAYPAMVPKAFALNFNGLEIVVNAASVTIDDDRYRITDNNGNTYTVDSCFGSEGINVYLRDDRTHVALKHYYGYLKYDVEGNCPIPVPPAIR